MAGGGVDVVLAEALDRLSRDQEDIAALFKRLRFSQVKLVTVSEGEIGDLHIPYRPQGREERLTGRAFCGACGGTLAAAGRDYLPSATPASSAPA